MNLELPIPPGAEERAHRVTRAAYASHRPTPRRRAYWKPAVAVVAVAAVVGALASPPGRSVIGSIREAVGVKKAQRELFSLPAAGRLLVDSARGAWVVQQDGSKRLLGPYRAASWSPFGRFVVALQDEELVTMEPNAKVHWTLARPGVRSPRWGGLRADTRIAYDARDGLHVVGGDGTGDRVLAPAEHGPFAWRPGYLSQLAYVSASEVRLEDTDRRTVLWRTARGPGERVLRIAWSADGSRLLVVSAHRLLVLDSRGGIVSHREGVFLDATFVGPTRRLAVLDAPGDVVLDGQNLFEAAGLRQLVSSPDGTWLLATRPAADQWVFVRALAPHTIRASSQIEQQFGRGTFPEVSGWIGH